MRFLFCSLDSVGFLYPEIGIASELRARGHEVAFATHTKFAEFLGSLGLLRLPRGQTDGPSFEVKSWFRPLRVALQVKHIEYAAQLFRPDVLVGQALTLGPMLVAERQEIPLAIMGLCTYLWPTQEADLLARPGRSEERDRAVWRYQETMDWLRQARNLFGMPLDTARRLCQSPLLGDLFLLRSVPELEARLEELPKRVHLVGSCLWEPEEVDRELEDWLAKAERDGAPLIYVQHGRFFEVPSFWSQLQAALADRGYWAAASVDRFDGQEDDTLRSERFFTRPYIPQSRLLRSANLVVSSANTTAVLGALAQGVPCLLIPGGGEQPDVAELAQSAGVAKVISPFDSTPERLSMAIAEVLGDARYKSRATHFRDAFAKMGGFGRAVDLLETLGRTGAPVWRADTHNVL